MNSFFFFFFFSFQWTVKRIGDCSKLNQTELQPSVYVLRYPGITPVIFVKLSWILVGVLYSNWKVYCDLERELQSCYGYV